MAVIKYDELFDFPGYKSAIKELEAANKDFGTTVNKINDRIAAQYKEIKTELDQYVGVLKSFNVNQKSANDALIKTGESALSAGKKLAEQKRIMNELVGTMDLTGKSVNELKTGLKGLESEFTSISGRSDDVIAKKKALAAEARRLKAAVKEETDALKLSTQVLDAAEGSYQAFQNELKSIGNQLKAMPNAFDAVSGKINQNNAAAVNLSKRYAEVNNVLKIADAQLGNYQRNVGNYASATFSLSQVLRELPSLGVSTQQFFLAISNNLPILFDQFGRLTKEIDAVTGKAVGISGALRIFGSSIFSLTNLLTIGVTLLTLYGKQFVDFIGSLFKGKNALQELDEVQKNYDKTLKSNTESANKEVATLKVLEQVATDTSKSMQTRNLAVKELQDKYPAYLSNLSKEAILSGQAASAIDDITRALYNKAIAEASTSRSAESAGKLLDRRKEEVDLLKQEKQAREDLNNEQAKGRQINIGGSTTGVTTGALDNVDKAIEKLSTVKDKIEANRAAQLILNKDIQFYNDQAANLFDDVLKLDDKKGGKGDKGKTRADIAEANRKAEFEIQKLQLEEKVKFNETILEDEKASLNDRLLALNVYIQKKKDLVDLDSSFEKGKKGLTAKEIEVIEQEKVNAINDIEREAAKKYQDIIKEKSVKEVDEAKALNKRIVDGYKSRVKELKDLTDANSKQAKEDLKDMYQNEINDADRLFKFLTEGRKASVFEELALIKKTYSIRRAQAMLIENEAKRQRELERLAAEEQLSKTAAIFDAIQQAATAALDEFAKTAKQKSENRIAVLEAEKQREIDLAGNNAAAKEAIEKKFQQRINQEKTKQAKQEKEFAAFQIIINTALAISKVLAEVPKFDFGISTGLLIGIYSALGAAQLAAVLARPLPKFRTGTKNAPEGMAIVDEGGPELIIDKSGKIREIGGNQGPRLTHLSEGSMVIPAQETQKIIREYQLTGQLSTSIRQGRQDEMIYVMAKAMQGNHMNEAILETAFKKAVKEIPVHNHIYDERGYRKRIDEVNQKTTYLNNLTKL